MIASRVWGSDKQGGKCAVMTVVFNMKFALLFVKGVGEMQPSSRSYHFEEFRRRGARAVRPSASPSVSSDPVIRKGGFWRDRGPGSAPPDIFRVVSLSLLPDDFGGNRGRRRGSSASAIGLVFSTGDWRGLFS